MENVENRRTMLIFIRKLKLVRVWNGENLYISFDTNEKEREMN